MRAIHGVSVLKDVITAHSEEYAASTGILIHFLLLQHVSEDFGANAEVVDPWYILESKWAEQLDNLAKWDILSIPCQLLVDDPEVTGEEFKAMVSTDEIADRFF